MTVLAKLGAFVVGILTAFPFLTFALVYVIVYAWKKDKRRALNWSVTITNLFLMHAVSVAYDLMWPGTWSVWWWIAAMFVTLVVCLAWLQIRVRGKVSLRKIGFSAWRLSFLLFCLGYVVLFSAGIWKTMQVG